VTFQIPQVAQSQYLPAYRELKESEVSTTEG
jgi:hypothetical protein